MGVWDLCIEGIGQKRCGTFAKKSVLLRICSENVAKIDRVCYFQQKHLVCTACLCSKEENCAGTTPPYTFLYMCRSYVADAVCSVNYLWGYRDVSSCNQHAGGRSCRQSCSLNWRWWTRSLLMTASAGTGTCGSGVSRPAQGGAAFLVGLACGWERSGAAIGGTLSSVDLPLDARTTCMLPGAMSECDIRRKKLVCWMLHILVRK